jgi:hypothetical protein
MTDIEASNVAWEAWKAGLAWVLGCGSAEWSRLAAGWPGRNAYASLGGSAPRPDHVSDTRSLLEMGGVLA